MTETQKRIEAYKKALPEIRERVIAVALLFAMSMAMMTSATFAWLTISRAPEVTAVSTTVAANGNLEIALATGDGAIAPGESKVGDSSAAEGQSVTAANITWGNLVNLSDPSYGLDNLVLRPAYLNVARLNESPLYGAVYDADGRITKLASNFSYSSWVMPEGNIEGYFGVSNSQYGVRAISSTKTEAVGEPAKYDDLANNADSLNAQAMTAYINLKNNSGYMNSLARMMGLFMTQNMSQEGQGEEYTNPKVEKEDIANLRDMYGAFLEAYELEFQAMAAMADLQRFAILTQNENYDYKEFQPIYTADIMKDSNVTVNSLAAENIKITGLDTLKKDYNTVKTDYAALCDLSERDGELRWANTGIDIIVSHLAKIDTCTVGGTPIGSIGVSNAMQYLSGTHDAVITNGILYNFELITGAKLEVEKITIKVKVKRSVIALEPEVSANISTSANQAENYFSKDLAYAESNKKFAGGTKMALDTYGLAVDIWVRTNADGSYLTLEGNILTESEDVRAMGKDPQNNEVELYTYTQEVTDTDENGETSTSTYTIDVYPVTEKDENNNDITVWRNAETHAPVDVGEEEPIAKMITIETVIGYEGENRWDDNDKMGVDATTQGAGSCYVYYADTPEDQARSLELLKSMKVAFVDAEGNLLANAEMDTEHFYADSGRVIVPLVLSTESINLGEDFKGNITYAITSLNKNEAKRITAIVYLDGTSLDNEDVLSAADIQGQLNIQFGSNMELDPIANEELELATRSVSASVDKTSFDYDSTTEPMITNVTVHVDGEQPNSVTAFFLRQINPTQGSREEAMTFTQNADGTWTSQYEFKVPGTYVIRTVQLDGVDYTLPADSTPKVVVTGFAMDYIRCDQAVNNHINVMTAASSTKADFKLKFSTEDQSKLPKSVEGKFLNDADGSANTITFVYNPTTQEWSGSVTFLNSGDYTMEYLVLDGEYFYLAEEKCFTASIILGMKVSVYTNSPTRFIYKNDMQPNEKLLAMQVKIMDNEGNELPGLSDAKLYYSAGGTRTMDTDLEWDGNNYVGELKMLEAGGPGIWKFGNVTVGVGDLTVATTSPIFTILSPEPPAPAGNNTKAEQYAPTNNAVMSVQFTNAQAAKAEATLVKTDREGKRYEHTAVCENPSTTESGINQFSFTIPKVDNSGKINENAGSQDGHWEITEVRLWDVFDADGKEYIREEPMTFEVDNNKTHVVTKFAVGFDKDYTDQSETFNGSFMQEHTVSDLVININGMDGALDISDVRIDYEYQGDSAGKGGYTGGNVPGKGVTAFSVEFDEVADGSGAEFEQKEEKTVIYAGTYNPKLSFNFTFGGTTHVITSDEANVTVYGTLPVFTVNSVKPTAKITGVSPGGTINTRLTWSTNFLGTPTFTATDNKTNSFSDYAATVYASATTDNSTIGNRHGFLAEPSIAINAQGIPNDYTVRLVLPAGSASEITFERTGSGKITKEIGKTSTIKYFGAGNRHYLEGYAGHGNVSIATMAITKDNVTYTVTLDNPLTITNPSSVDKLS